MSSLDIWYNLNQNWNVSVTPEMGEKKRGGGRDPGEGWSSVAQLDNVFLRLFTNESDQAGRQVNE